MTESTDFQVGAQFYRKVKTVQVEILMLTRQLTVAIMLDRRDGAAASLILILEDLLKTSEFTAQFTALTAHQKLLVRDLYFHLRDLPSDPRRTNTET